MTGFVVQGLICALFNLIAVLDCYLASLNIVIEKNCSYFNDRNTSVLMRALWYFYHDSIWKTVVLP